MNTSWNALLLTIVAIVFLYRGLIELACIIYDSVKTPLLRVFCAHPKNEVEWGTGTPEKQGGRYCRRCGAEVTLWE